MKPRAFDFAADFKLPAAFRRLCVETILIIALFG